MTETFDPCEETRKSLRAFQRGELPPTRQQEVAAHLDTCAGCRQVLTTESALDAALQEKLPRFTAPLRLRRQLAGAWTSLPQAEAAPAPSPPPRRPAPDRRSVLIGFAVAAAFVFSWVTFRAGRAPDAGTGALVTEAVNDHLRVVQSSHPVEIESGGIHQVKPWFTGKVDFAPRVTFSGDEEFPLIGGSVGYFVDRKAAVFTFRHKLHTLTLLVLPRAGLPWPAAQSTTSRGFHLRFWQRDDLGFVLVSDASDATLGALASRLEAD